MIVTITFDAPKRNATMQERGLAFEDAAKVFAEETITFEDVRKDYGERRFITVGHLNGRMVVVGWTPRGADRHVFSMRKADDREQKRYRF